MKKKILMSLILLAIIGASVVFAQQPTLDKLKFIVATQNNVQTYIVEPINKSISGAVVIPAIHEGKRISTTRGFRDITSITSVTFLGDTLIQQGAFRECTGITSVTMNAEVRPEQHVFNGCTSLTSVTFQGAPTINYARNRSMGLGTFPGDLIDKWQTGGAGVYTRQRGSDTWTRTGDAPVVVVNTSLNGIWELGGTQITINDSNGTITAINPTPLWQDAMNKGYVKVGDQNWRNISSTGNLTWSAQALEVTWGNNNRNVATGTRWVNGTITMNADGRTIVDHFGYTWTRR